MAALLPLDALKSETDTATTNTKASHPQSGRRCRLANEPSITFLS